jgi:hypothetical protein
MINPFDLLPDELGEYIGCSLFTGATYLYVDHIKSQAQNEKSKVDVARQKIDELSRSMEKNCLSDEALNYLKNQK